MSAATATVSVYKYPKGHDNTQRTVILRGTIVLAQGNYPAGGFPLSWSNIPQLQTIPLGSSTPSSTGTIIPIDMDVKSTANPPSGIVWIWDSVLGNLRAFICASETPCAISGPLVEFGGAALPGWMLNDTIQFTAVFARD